MSAKLAVSFFEKTVLTNPTGGQPVWHVLRENNDVDSVILVVERLLDRLVHLSLLRPDSVLYQQTRQGLRTPEFRDRVASELEKQV